MSLHRRKSLVKNLAAEVLEPRCLLTGDTGIVDSSALVFLDPAQSIAVPQLNVATHVQLMELIPAVIHRQIPVELDCYPEWWFAQQEEIWRMVLSSSIEKDIGESGDGIETLKVASEPPDAASISDESHRDPNTEPIPGYYASQELWLAAYTQWLVDQGFISDPESNSSSQIGSESDDPAPRFDDYADEDDWLADYQQWLIAHGFLGPAEPPNDPIQPTTVETVGEASRVENPDAEPIPGYYASQELWLAAYRQWLIDQGFLSDPESNSSTESGSETDDPAPRFDDYSDEDLWLADYRQWLIAHGFFGPAELSDSDRILDDGSGDSLEVLPSSAQLIGQWIATVGIEARELAEFETASSDSAFGELADSEPEDGDALAANGDTNSADMGEGLELDAALSDDFLVSLAETFPN